MLKFIIFSTCLVTALSWPKTFNEIVDAKREANIHIETFIDHVFPNLAEGQHEGFKNILKDFVKCAYPKHEKAMKEVLIKTVGALVAKQAPTPAFWGCNETVREECPELQKTLIQCVRSPKNLENVQFVEAFKQVIRAPFWFFTNFPNHIAFLEAIEELDRTPAFAYNKRILERIATYEDIEDKEPSDACLPLFLSKILRKAFMETDDFHPFHLNGLESVTRTIATLHLKVPYITADECLNFLV